MGWRQGPLWLWAVVPRAGVGCQWACHVAADFEFGPKIIPPGGSAAPGGAVFFFRLVPGPLRVLAQFAMDFMSVVVVAGILDVSIGCAQFGDSLAGEIGWQTALPVLMLAFDFPLGIGGVTQAHVVEAEGGS